MTLLYVWIFLSIVLESFPISSSGHLALLEQLIGQAIQVPVGLDHFVHCAPALILPIYFFKPWQSIMKLHSSWGSIIYMCWLGFIVEIITVIFYFLFAQTGTEFFPVWFGFFITGCLLYSLRNSYASGADWNMHNSVGLGFGQGIALLPGISRFGITYVIARWNGIERRTAFALSFLIEWPISIAGFAKGAYILHKQQLLTQLLNPSVLLIIFIAMILMYFGLWIMDYLVQKNRVWMFAYYLFAVSSVALWAKLKGLNDRRINY